MMKTVFILLCGIATTFGDSRIVGGATAPVGAFPYQISMRYNNFHTCGGSIVNPTTILTAAHCVKASSPTAGLTVVVGTNTLNQGGIAHLVSQAIVHPNYNAQKITDDIAILKLYTSISYNNIVKPIGLATKHTPGGQIAIISGWGLTSYPGQNSPNNMQYVTLTTLDLNTCNRLNPTSAPITVGNVCTTSPWGKGVCSGDSGGPLVVNGIQVGVVSWVVPCAKGYPDVFTSVAYYRNWIAQYA